MIGRRLWTGLGAAALFAAAVAILVRFVPLAYRPLVAIAALAPYLSVGAPLALVVFAALRRWVLAMLAITLTAIVVALQAPLYVGEDGAAGVTVRFISANLRYGQADPAAVTELAREHADVLAVQELTPGAARWLAAAGLDAAFPFRALRPMDGPAGVGIWSRYPITATDVDERFWLGLLTARVAVPTVPEDVTVLTTHMSAPWPDPLQGWRDDVRRFATALQTMAEHTNGPILVAGDLNSTTDMREFRQLLKAGYRDAAEQAGAGLTRTHPADIAVPPVFAVDHILLRDCTAVSVRTASVRGSDHRAIVADVALPTPTRSFGP